MNFERNDMREMICINCPIGCNLKVYGDSEENIRVEGNKCPRGLQYGKDEVLNPKRMVTSSVPLSVDENTGIYQMISVKTSEAVPKNLIFSVLEEIKRIDLKKEGIKKIEVGDVLLENVCNTGVNIVATQKN